MPYPCHVFLNFIISLSTLYCTVSMSMLHRPWLKVLAKTICKEYWNKYIYIYITYKLKCPEERCNHCLENQTVWIRTLSTTITSTDPQLTRVLTMLREFSALLGCTTRRSFVLTPMPFANERSIAFSTSRYAQHPAKQYKFAA